MMKLNAYFDEEAKCCIVKISDSFYATILGEQNIIPLPSVIKTFSGALAITKQAMALQKMLTVKIEEAINAGH